jgi:hypothetical protein
MNNTTTTALPIDDEWQSIDTAPLDRIVLLYRPTATKLAIQVAPGKYETNQYAKNPQPYWEVWLRIWNGVTESRAYPPTHWRDYPSPPLPTLEPGHGSAAPAPAQPEPKAFLMADTVRFGKLHRTMLERGVYLAPSAFGAEGLTDGELDGMERRYWKLGSSIEIEPQGISEVWDRKETFDHRAFARAAIAADRARRPTPHTPADAEVRE